MALTRGVAILLLELATLCLSSRAYAAEIIVREGGYRFTCPDDWEVRKGERRVFMFTPGGLISGGFMTAGAAHVAFLVESDPEDRFSALLHNKDGDLRNLVRIARDGARPVRIEYIDRFADEITERQSVVTCPKIGDAYVCVHLQYLVGDPHPNRHRHVYEELLRTLRTADPTGPTTPDWLSNPAATP